MDEPWTGRRASVLITRSDRGKSIPRPRKANPGRHPPVRSPSHPGSSRPLISGVKKTCTKSAANRHSFHGGVCRATDRENPAGVDGRAVEPGRPDGARGKSPGERRGPRSRGTGAGRDCPTNALRATPDGPRPGRRPKHGRRVSRQRPGRRSPRGIRAGVRGIRHPPRRRGRVPPPARRSRPRTRGDRASLCGPLPPVARDGDPAARPDRGGGLGGVVEWSRLNTGGHREGSESGACSGASRSVGGLGVGCYGADPAGSAHRIFSVVARSRNEAAREAAGVGCGSGWTAPEARRGASRRAACIRGGAACRRSRRDGRDRTSRTPAR